MNIVRDSLKWIFFFAGGVAAVIGLLIYFSKPHPQDFKTGDQTEDAKQEIYQNLGYLHDVIASYGKQHNAGRVPEFSSAHLPAWYAQYGGQALRADVIYEVPKAIVGMQIRDLHQRVFVVASGPIAVRLFPKKGVAQIAYAIM